MNEDIALRKLLHEQLRTDKDGAPEFDRLWSGAIAQRRRRRALFSLASSAAVLLVLGSVFIHTARKHAPAAVPDPLPWRSEVLLTEWRSPTDALMPSDFQ
jgi:hypothetical protein